MRSKAGFEFSSVNVFMINTNGVPNLAVANVFANFNDFSYCADSKVIIFMFTLKQKQIVFADGCKKYFNLNIILSKRSELSRSKLESVILNGQSGDFFGH